MVRSKCHAKDGTAGRPVTLLFSERKAPGFNRNQGQNSELVAALSQGGGFQPVVAPERCQSAGCQETLKPR